VHNMYLVRPVLLFLNVHDLKMFYEQINGWMDGWMDGMSRWHGFSYGPYVIPVTGQQETQVTDPNHFPDLVLCSSTTGLLKEGALLPLRPGFLTPAPSLRKGDCYSLQGSNDVYEFLSGVPVTPMTSFVDVSRDDVRQEYMKVVHYMRYALAAYGWPMYMMTTGTGLCRILPRLRSAALSSPALSARPASRFRRRAYVLLTFLNVAPLIRQRLDGSQRGLLR